MSRVLTGLGFLTAVLAGALSAPSQTAAPPKTSLKVGDIAPDFKLPDQNRKEVRLSDFRGKENVVLAFYALAFTGG